MWLVVWIILRPARESWLLLVFNELQHACVARMIVSPCSHLDSLYNRVLRKVFVACRLRVDRLCWRMLSCAALVLGGWGGHAPCTQLLFLCAMFFGLLV